MGKNRKKAVSVTYGANLAYAKAMNGLRASGAAGAHGDRRTKRLRDRSAQRRAAIREQW